MADSKVQIEVTADTSDAKQKLADLEAQADRAMDAGANSAKKFAKGLDEVGKSAELSARQIKGVVAGMASMAAGVASAALKAQGREKEASYLGGAASGAVQGAGMFAPLGPAAMAAGALGGAAIGAARNYFEREAQGKEQAASMRDLADSLEKAREKMQAAKERADGFAGTLDRLGDVSRSTQQREAERAAEIEKRQNAVADATERMAAAEKALREQAANISGPQTEEQKKAADKIREAWAEANNDLQAAQGELDRLKDAKVEAAKPAPQKPLDQRGDGPQVSAIEKLGAKFGSAQGDDKGDAIVGAVDNLAPAFADGAQDVAGAVDAAAKDVSRSVSQSLGGLVIPPPKEPPAPVSADSIGASVARSLPEPPAPTTAGEIGDAVARAIPQPDSQTTEPPTVDAAPLKDAADGLVAGVAPLGVAAQNITNAASAFGPAADGLVAAAATISEFGRATDSLEREGNRIATQQLDALRLIASKMGGGATFA